MQTERIGSPITDRAWRKFGQDEPYFGVLSQPRFRRESISTTDKQAFFQSGKEYVDQMLKVARSRVDAPQRFGRALDFGCGVGRLTIPLAAHADQVIGLDISPGMITEAIANCERFGAANVTIAPSQPWPNPTPGGYDLVHSYIVLQHVPTRAGMMLLKRLVGAVGPGGTGVLHLTYGKSSEALRWLTRITTWVPMAHNIVNLLRGRQFFAPMMQMNDYDLNEVLQLLQNSGVVDFHTQFTNHGGHLGVCFYFKKPKTSTAALAAR
jgi:2-polyprenyl-3-methyl-5-hydroxy-6-metoxy-1,4-benzoquinol methylase